MCGEDLYAILAAIDSDCFNNEVNFSAEMDALIDNISLELKDTFKCDFCVKGLYLERRTHSPYQCQARRTDERSINQW